MRLASDLREASWGLAQAAVSSLRPEEPYPAYARRHLGRFLKAAEATA